jgi:hypothetical protein
VGGDLPPFQSQTWHTDDTTGHALPGEPGAILTLVF